MAIIILKPKNETLGDIIETLQAGLDNLTYVMHGLMLLNEQDSDEIFNSIWPILEQMRTYIDYLKTEIPI